MPAVRVSSERSASALKFQLKAKTTGAAVLRAFAKQEEAIDVQTAGLRRTDGSDVDLSAALLGQISDGDLLLVVAPELERLEPEPEPEPERSAPEAGSEADSDSERDRDDAGGREDSESEAGRGPVIEAVDAFAFGLARHT